MIDPPDDLADLLAPRPGGPSAAARAAILRQTERGLARRWWLRRGTRTAFVASLVAAGGAVGWFARTPVADAPASPAVEVVVVPVVVPIIQPPVADTPSAPAPTLSASAVELLAEQADDALAAARLYRQAGDAFLREQDYPNATRCYRLFLARSGQAALALDPNDSWLLVSLKNAAYKEKIDGTKNDS
jgi:hypothetical protein